MVHDKQALSLPELLKCDKKQIHLAIFVDGLASYAKVLAVWLRVGMGKWLHMQLLL